MAAAVIAVVALAVPATAAEQHRTELLGSNEVGGGDLDGHGYARVSFDQSGVVCFDIRVAGVDPIAAAHIHAASAGVNGGVVVNFGVDVNGLSGCVEADAAVIEAIRANPADYYVNVHNGAFPAGALRGQLG